MDHQKQNEPKHTVICSDMHLCEAEPINPNYPLWKKYKTAQFFFDESFQNFLRLIQQKASGNRIELVLNGDTFDFDSVMAMPENPTFRISPLEKMRGLNPRSEKSLFKIKKILDDHAIWVEALREFLLHGNTIVFVMGNHDLELHFFEVQEEILNRIVANSDCLARVRFVEWFYISNGDTLIEHGNQYDPYCLCEDPVHPYVYRYTHKEVKLPFGNLACRYILNGMGFFNPHVDKNYIMSIRQYVKFFFKYMIKAQPLLMWDWFFGSLVTLVQSFKDRFASTVRDPLKNEDRINAIAARSKAEPRMVRELQELFVEPAGRQPILLAKELWLDRTFLVLIAFYFLAMVFLVIKQVFDISFFWVFIPLFALFPFFIFYSKSVQSMVSSYKEPNEKILAMAGLITKTKRIVFGHTHQPRHEIIGAVEHLNCGCWSPAFLDVECTKPIDQKTFVWIFPTESNEQRTAELMQFKDGELKLLMRHSRR